MFVDIIISFIPISIAVIWDTLIVKPSVRAKAIFITTFFQVNQSTGDAPPKYLQGNNETTNHDDPRQLETSNADNQATKYDDQSDGQLADYAQQPDDSGANEPTTFYDCHTEPEESYAENQTNNYDVQSDGQLADYAQQPDDSGANDQTNNHDHFGNPQPEESYAKNQTTQVDEPKPKTGKFDDGECAFCLDSPQNDKSFPPCGHTFCFRCLEKWCLTKMECPTCVQKFTFFDHENGKRRHFPNNVAETQMRASNNFWEMIHNNLLPATFDSNWNWVPRNAPPAVHINNYDVASHILPTIILPTETSNIENEEEIEEEDSDPQSSPRIEFRYNSAPYFVEIDREDLDRLSMHYALTREIRKKETKRRLLESRRNEHSWLLKKWNKRRIKKLERDMALLDNEREGILDGRHKSKLVRKLKQNIAII